MVRDTLIAQLTRHEGKRLKPYTDTKGKITIGYGRNLSDVGISDEEARLLLSHDIDKVVHDLNNNLPWWSGMSEDVQLVLANMTYNMGMGKVLGFQKFLMALRQRNYQTARAEMLDSVWASEVGGRALELADLIYKQ